MKPDSPSPRPAASDLASRQEVPNDPSVEVNFALVLSRMIDSMQQDPIQLRETVYEMARVKLREQFGREDVREMNRLVGALETAIQGVEAFSRAQDQRAAALPPPAAADINAPGPDWGPAEADRGAEVELHPPRARRVATPAQSGEPVSDRAARDPIVVGEAAAAVLKPRRARPLAFLGRLAAVLVISGAVVAAAYSWPRLRHQLERIGPLQTAAKPEAAASGKGEVATRPVAMAEPPPAAPSLPFPVPTTFGIYAVSEGRLAELKPLPGRIPDRRVAMSAAITAPSQTTLADGTAKFIVFRRDSANDAPDHTEVRVIAKVVRAMAVDPAKKAVLAPAQDSWVIRNVGFSYKVGPVDGQPEMYLVQPETDDQVLPAGRYALVIKGQGFDFTVAGPVTDPRQCLERVDAVNGAFYSPCPGK